MAKYSFILLVISLLMSCGSENQLSVEIYETSAAGNQLTPITSEEKVKGGPQIKLNPTEEFQTITGFGGIIYRGISLSAKSAK